MSEQERPVQAWLADMRAFFGDDETRVPFGTRLRYVKGPGAERGKPGPEGVRPVLQIRMETKE